MLDRINIFLILLCFIPEFLSANNEILIFPDAMELENDDGQPFLSVREEDRGIVARFRFQSSWQVSQSALRRQLGEDYFATSFIKVNLVPNHIDFTSEFFKKDNPALIDSQVTYVQNGVIMEFVFSHDYSVAQIREAVLFPISIATVDAKIVCQGSLVFSVCGDQIKRLPLMNSFSSNFDEIRLLKKQHFIYLRSYASHQVVTQFDFLSTSYSDYVREKIWNDNCDNLRSPWHREACDITQKYSQSMSIREAVLSLSKDVYPEDVLQVNADYFIFQGSTLNASRLNLAMDFERIRQELNRNFRLINSRESLNIRVPLVSDIELTNHLVFDVKPDAIYWNDQEIALMQDQHMHGQAIIFLRTFGGWYEIPVRYDVSIGFRYNPVSKQVNLTGFEIKNLEFLNKNGLGYNFIAQYQDTVEFAINGILNTTDQVQQTESIIRNLMQFIQDANIGFQPIF